MQVNLGYRLKAFATLEDVFSQEKSVAYTARFLRELRQSKCSWTMEVDYYHSASWSFNAHYRLKVMHYLNLAWRVDQLRDMVQHKRARDKLRPKILQN
jgi:hypothetical protein